MCLGIFGDYPVKSCGLESTTSGRTGGLIVYRSKRLNKLHCLLHADLCPMDRRSSAFCPRVSAFKKPGTAKLTAQRISVRALSFRFQISGFRPSTRNLPCLGICMGALSSLAGERAELRSRKACLILSRRDWPGLRHPNPDAWCRSYCIVLQIWPRLR